MKNTYYQATIQETGEQKVFDTKKATKIWARKATMSLQHDLTISVVKVTEIETQLNASYTTGEVEEVDA